MAQLGFTFIAASDIEMGEELFWGYDLKFQQPSNQMDPKPKPPAKPSPQGKQLAKPKDSPVASVASVDDVADDIPINEPKGARGRSYGRGLQCI